MSESESSNQPAAEHFLAVTDVRRAVSSILPFGGGRGTLGRSDFESRRLNELVGMVENARPGDLEATADALWKAADDIRGIGEDIKTYAGRVEWEGDSAGAFQKWAANLATNTLRLADYTSASSTQLKAAAVGLASVKSGMPPRDAAEDLGFAAPLLTDVPVPAQVDGNPAYEAAKKEAATQKEKDRQEAINQMNRLSSYYHVSRDVMTGLEEPTFDRMPDVGVPRSDGRVWAPEGQAAGGVESHGGSVGPSSTSVAAPSVDNASYGGRASEYFERTASTNLSGGVAAPPVAVEQGRTSLAGGATSGLPGPVASAPVAPPGGPVPVTHGPVSANPAGGGARSGVSGGRAPSPWSKQSPGAGSRPGGVPSSSAGPVGRPGTAQPAGRVGRADGISGGTPARSSSLPPSPRLPRGTVVGGEGGPTGRPAGGLGGGAGGPAGGNQQSTGRRLAGERGGVVSGSRQGTPVGREFTRGGSGLANSAGNAAGLGRPMAPAGAGSSARAERRSGDEVQRPDYLTEDESTWADQRGTAPRVIE